MSNNPDPIVTAWVTKYALTLGILKVKGQHCLSIDPGFLSYLPYGDAHGNDWHLSEQDALQRAEAMRLAKIAAMKKQIAKLEKMQFKIEDRTK